jgi:adenylate kinase family enzyme
VAERINIKGTSGSGKTTLGKELARRLDLPFFELDALHHGPNWAEPPDDVFRGRIQAAMDADPRGWVIDGNYERKLGRLVIDRAEVVVWLDMPLGLILRRLWLRTNDRIRNKVELWNGNRETWRGAFLATDSLFVWAVRSWIRHRREWPTLLGSHPGFVRLRSPAEAAHWLEQFVQ